MKNAQIIKCRIESCAHNSPDHRCELHSIDVCPCRPCDCDSVSDKSESMCASFVEKHRGLF